MEPSLVDAGRDLVLGSGCVGCGRPGKALCPGCRATLPRDAALAWPDPTPPGLAPPYAAGAYDGLLRALVLHHKEHGVFALAGPLGDVLAEVVAALLLDLAPGPAGRPRRPGRPASCGRVLLVPVPSRRPVVRRRGHDPLLRVTRHAAGRLRARGVEASVVRLLVPAGRVLDQAGLDARERARNLAGSMTARTGAHAPAAGARAVVVVDDVLTTGATAREAQRALEAAGIPVTAVAAVAATRRLHTRQGRPGRPGGPPTAGEAGVPPAARPGHPGVPFTDQWD